MKLAIPAPHGKAIADRQHDLQEVNRHLQTMLREDKRHINAVLETLGHDPAGYVHYDLKREGDNWYLELVPVAPEPAMLPTEQQTVNGAVQPVI